MRTEEMMKRLEAADPVDASDVATWPSSDRGREILRRAVSTPLEESPPGRRRYTPRLVLSAVAAIAAVAIGLQVVPRQGASAEAAEVLHAAARVAERQPQMPVSAQGYRYSRSETAYRGYYDACSIPVKPGEAPLSCPMPPPDDWAFSVLGHTTREIWVAPDGSGRLLLEKSGAPTFFGPRDEARWKAAGSPEFDRAGTSDESFGPGGLTYEDFSTYSTDADELYDQIRTKAKGYGPSTDAEMLVLVGDLLRETVAPPELRGALFRVAARIPGVELVGEVTDPAGRKGTAVARTSDDGGFLERKELIFDPETSELLSERDILLERVDWADAEPGTVIGYAVYLRSGIVDSTSERP